MSKVKPQLQFRVPIFCSKVRVFLTDDVFKIAQQLDVEITPPCQAFEFTDESTVNIVLPQDRWQDYLIHECVHATWSTLACCNIEVCRETEEVFAYLFEYLVDYIKDKLE